MAFRLQSVLCTLFKTALCRARLCTVVTVWQYQKTETR